jgi:transcriptional regulator with XRE-family HTH domain
VWEYWGVESLTLNIRYLLWREGVRRDEWAAKLADLLGCDIRRAQEILSGGVDLQPKEIAAMAKAYKVGVNDMRTLSLLSKEKDDMLTANIRHLIDGLAHGQRRQFAAELGVDVTTVSRWSTAAQRPTKTKLGRIRDYFGLPFATDLEGDPIFLSLDPITGSEMRSWIHEQIEGLDADTLRNLFPALQRLLKRG